MKLRPPAKLGSSKIAMPRQSRRARLIAQYVSILRKRLPHHYVRQLFDVLDCEEDNFNDFILTRFIQLISTRYSSPRRQRPRQSNFAWFLFECSDREFLRSSRMERSSFQNLVSLVENEPMFQSKAGGRNMAAPEKQLLVFLKFIGTQGSDASTENLSVLFGIGSGVSYEYIRPCTSALLSLYDDVVRWPSSEEQKVLSHKIAAGFDFPNCVELVDGTLLPLAFKPMLNGEDYFTRKGGYAINALILCDDQSRVTHLVSGWPGSTHANRVWSNSATCEKATEYFDGGQYILGDSAFRASRYPVPAYKKLPGGNMSREREFFNHKLAKLRIRVEYCIGLLKARFHFFRGVRVVITSRADLKRIIRLFMSAVVVHNLLILEPLPTELQEDYEEVSSVGQDEVIYEDDETNHLDIVTTDEDHRDQLFCHLVEKDDRF